MIAKVMLAALIVALAAPATAGDLKEEDFTPFIAKSNIEPKVQGAISGQTGGVGIQARQIPDFGGTFPDRALKFEEGFEGLDFVGDDELLRNVKDLRELFNVSPELVRELHPELFR